MSGGGGDESVPHVWVTGRQEATRDTHAPNEVQSRVGSKQKREQEGRGGGGTPVSCLLFEENLTI